MRSVFDHTCPGMQIVGSHALRRDKLTNRLFPQLRNQIKKLGRRQVLFEDDCARAVAAFNPVFEIFKTQVVRPAETF